MQISTLVHDVIDYMQLLLLYVQKEHNDKRAYADTIKISPNTAADDREVVPGGSGDEWCTV